MGSWMILPGSFGLAAARHASGILVQRLSKAAAVMVWRRPWRTARAMPAPSRSGPLPDPIWDAYLTSGLRRSLRDNVHYSRRQKLEHDHPPTPKHRKKDNQHKPSYIHVATFCSLLHCSDVDRRFRPEPAMKDAATLRLTARDVYRRLLSILDSGGCRSYGSDAQ